MNSIARRACQAPDYAGVAKKAILEMHAQTQDLTLDARGGAVRGVLVRHLVLPENLAGTRRVMGFLAREVSADTYVNIMPQYRPLGNAGEIPELARTVTRKEYEAALDTARDQGITRLDRRPRFFLV